MFRWGEWGLGNWDGFIVAAMQQDKVVLHLPVLHVPRKRTHQITAKKKTQSQAIPNVQSQANPIRKDIAILSAIHLAAPQTSRSPPWLSEASCCESRIKGLYLLLCLVRFLGVSPSRPLPQVQSKF